MSFDEDPRDKRQRFLISFEESDDFLGEVWSESERDNALANGAEDVTDVPFFEKKFADRQFLKSIKK